MLPNASSSQLLSATDLSTFSACRRASLLDREVAAGRLERPYRNDPAIRLLQERGRQHEARYKAALETQLSTVSFQVEGSIPRTPEDWETATERTLDAMRQGYRVIYQAPLATAGWHGMAWPTSSFG